MTASAANLARLWTRVYTSGLDPVLREARRAEIESDLWESQQDADARAQILPRLVAGILDDILWRVTHVPMTTVLSALRLLAICVALLALGEWLLNAQANTTIRESQWLFPVTATVHVFGLIVFLGLTVMLDLRLIGVTLRGVRVSEIVAGLMPWAAAGAAVAVVSGMLVYMSDPPQYLGNVFFRIKAVVLVLAILNSWIFHAGVYQRVGEWDLAPVPPPAARLAGYVSLALWATVTVSGRLIPYLWF
jgi:hypothetical protein